MSSTPRVKTGLQGEGRHIFVCKKFPFEILRNAYSPNENLVDENFVHRLNLNQSNLTCENYRIGSETVRIVGKISTTVQIIAEGAIVGSMQLKANVVRDLKLLFGTEALPGHVLSQKLSKFENSENLNELRSMKTKPNAKKTEPTKKIKSTKKNECEVSPDKKESITNDCDMTQHENAAKSSDSYLQSFITKLNAMKSELESKFYSNEQHLEAAPDQEGAHHTLAPDQTPEKNANDLDNESIALILSAP